MLNITFVYIVANFVQLEDEFWPLDCYFPIPSINFNLPQHLIYGKLQLSTAMLDELMLRERLSYCKWDGKKLK